MGKASFFLIRAVIPKASSILLSWAVCALVSTQHLLKTSYDVVKRWVNEAQEAASSDNIMVQVGKPPAGAQPDISGPQRGVKSPRWVSDTLFPCTVSCSGLALPRAEERSPGSQQDAQQVHPPRPQVAICLLHDDPSSQQAAGGGGWQVRGLFCPAGRISSGPASISSCRLTFHLMRAIISVFEEQCTTSKLLMVKRRQNKCQGAVMLWDRFCKSCLCMCLPIKFLFLFPVLCICSLSRSSLSFCLL